MTAKSTKADKTPETPEAAQAPKDAAKDAPTPESTPEPQKAADTPAPEPTDPVEPETPEGERDEVSKGTTFTEAAEVVVNVDPRPGYATARDKGLDFTSQSVAAQALYGTGRR